MKGTVRKKKVFVWDERKRKVAEAIAKGDRSAKEILTEFHITEPMFYRWKKYPEFQQGIDEFAKDIDITLKKNRLKIIKQEIKRVLARLELDEDHPTSRDLVALLKLAGEEVGDYEEHKSLKIIIEGFDKKE